MVRVRLLLLAAGLVLTAGLVALATRGAAPAPADAVALPTTTSAPPTLPPSPRPAATAPSEPTPEPSPPPLGPRIDALLADPALQGARVALSVRDERGAPVIERDATTPLLPASTQKSAVAAAALARLGPDFRFRTVVVAETTPDAAGVLAGDLVLVGGGDPTLDTAVFRGQVAPQRPHTPLEGLADQLVAAGLRHVTGGVLADPWLFADEPLAPGWRERYLTELDATRVSGLTVDAGRKLFVEGGRLRAMASPDPASEAAAALLTALRQRGVQVDGGVARTAGPSRAERELAAVDSPPLDEVLRWMLQRSDNHVAEAVFRTLGVMAGAPTWAGAEQAARDALASAGLDWTGVQLADGSGLSRHNRAPVTFLSALEALLARSDAAARWASWQAVAGESGTLRRRLVGTVAAGRLRGKTGSLEDVRSLVGTVEGPGGRRWHLALVVNGMPRTATSAVRAMMDEVVLALAEQLYGCVRVAASVDGDQPPDPAFHLRCRAA